MFHYTRFCKNNLCLDTISCLLTPRIRVPEKLTCSQLVEKFPAFYGTRSFITLFRSARHLSLSRASSIQSISPHPTSWIPILMLSSHLCLGLHNGLFPSSFPNKTLYKPLLSPICATCPSISFFSICSPKQYLVRSIDHSAPHYVVFFPPLLTRFS